MSVALNGAMFGIVLGAAIAGSEIGFFVSVSAYFGAMMICATIKSALSEHKSLPGGLS